MRLGFPQTSMDTNHFLLIRSLVVLKEDNLIFMLHNPPKKNQNVLSYTIINFIVCLFAHCPIT